jgi:hypothetical protein
VVEGLEVGLFDCPLFRIHFLQALWLCRAGPHLRSQRGAHETHAVLRIGKPDNHLDLWGGVRCSVGNHELPPRPFALLPPKPQIGIRVLPTEWLVGQDPHRPC